MRRAIRILPFFLLCFAFCQAEECNCISGLNARHPNMKIPLTKQFAVGARIGTAGLTYQSDFGRLSPNLHAGFDVSYALLWRGVGVRLGLGLSYAASDFKAANYADRYSTVDVERDQMDVYYTIAKLNERHTQWFFEVPLQLALDFRKVSLNIGPKVLFGISPKYRQTQQSADLRAYYPLYDVEIDHALALAAGNEAKAASKGDVKSYPFCWIAGAFDLNYYINLKRSGRRLSVGVYADVAFHTQNLPRTRNLSLLSITETSESVPVSRQTESVLRANHAETGKQVVSRFGYFDTGFRVTYYLIYK